MKKFIYKNKIELIFLILGVCYISYIVLGNPSLWRWQIINPIAWITIIIIFHLIFKKND